MSAPDKGTKKPSFDEKPPLSADAVEQNIFERQLFDGPNYNGSFNEKVAPLSPTTASTVEDVVRQQNLGRKPSPEHDLPFDFNRFLEQMKHKSAQPTAHFVYRFQKEFEKKPWTINEQTKIVHDFLDFISNQMRECELWRNASEQEFENAREGMEKLVMNRLYTLTFTPAIKGAVTTDDRERDEILHQKIQIFRWINEKHLDIPESKHNDSFLSFAKTELLKINNFKAPRDKLICILNCCKVIFGLIRQVDGEEGADKFLPILIFVVLRANPDHLVSNVQYISRFRNQEKLQSESGYYLSSLMGAISFIENMDVSSLSITQEEFDKNIEITVKELEQEIPKPKENDTIISYANVLPPSKAPQPVRPPIINPAQARALFENGKILAQNRIQRPLINIFGRLIAEMANDPNEPPTPEASNEFSDMQEEAAHITAQEYESSFETLRAMFPNYDPDVYESVLQATDGGLARAIDALLEMSGSINDLGGGLEVEGGNQTASPTIVTGEAPQKEEHSVHEVT